MQQAAVASAASAALQKVFMGPLFCSLPLDGAQTVGAASGPAPITIWLANYQSNPNANFKLGALNIYVWRPSTGTKVGSIIDLPGLGVSFGAEPGSINQFWANGLLIAHSTTPVSAADGDIIVVEPWNVSTQDSATSYDVRLGFAGSVETTTAAVVTDHAGFIVFAETLAFKAGTIASGDGSVSIQTDVQGAGGFVVSAAGSVSIQMSVAGASKVYSPSAGAVTIQSACAAQGRAVQNAVASIAIVSDVEAVSGTSPIIAGAASMAFGFDVSGVGKQHFPHIFEQEAPLSDPWIKEAAL